jgi:hypothetical protein
MGVFQVENLPGLTLVFKPVKKHLTVMPFNGRILEQIYQIRMMEPLTITRFS